MLSLKSFTAAMRAGSYLKYVNAHATPIAPPIPNPKRLEVAVLVAVLDVFETGRWFYR